MKAETRTLDWHSVATLAWDGDDLIDFSTGMRARSDGSISQQTLTMTFPFDRAMALRDKKALWSVLWSNRGTKAVLMKNGHVQRELNRSFYCATEYDYPIALGRASDGLAVIAHCPQEFNILEIEDVETRRNVRKIQTKDMEFHSRLLFSPKGQFLLDAGWFWHPWNGACVFDLHHFGKQSFSKDVSFNVTFSSSSEIDGATLLNDYNVIVSTRADSEPPSESDALLPKQIGVWSLKDLRWESKASLNEPTGTILAWKHYAISLYDHVKLIDLATGDVAHRWESIRTGKQSGPIELGDPPPPPMAFDSETGRLAVADAKTVTILALN